MAFHILEYSKPIQFVSVRFINEKAPKFNEEVIQNIDEKHMEEIPECQHCHRVGHLETNCFDLHPCQHCGKKNHSSEKCSKRSNPTRLKIHYGWINSWQWTSTTKKLHKSYRRIQSCLKTHLVAQSLFVPDRV